jgi:hypothetical protein
MLRYFCVASALLLLLPLCYSAAVDPLLRLIALVLRCRCAAAYAGAALLLRFWARCCC